MKIAPSKTNRTSTKSKPLLPLVEDLELYKLNKTSSVSWELSTQPGTVGAPTYKFQVCLLQGDETPRQMVHWRIDVQRVCVGLNVTTKETRKPIMEASMRTGPLASFHAGCRVCAGRRYDEALAVACQADTTNGNTAASDAVLRHNSRFRDFKKRS